MEGDEYNSSRKRIADGEIYKDQCQVSDGEEPEAGPFQKKRVADRKIKSGTSARVSKEKEEDGGERKEVVAKEDREEAEKTKVNVERENVEGERVEVTNEEKEADEGGNVGGERKGVGCEIGKDENRDEKGSGEDKEDVGGEKKEGKVEGGTTVTDRKEEPKPAANFISFQHLSSSQNAFSGHSGTGFSTSSNIFGSRTTSTSLFGVVRTNNGSSSASVTGFVGSPTETSKVTMQEVQVETGEENEAAVFTSDAVLYEYLDGGWKERGEGELKLNLSTTCDNKARLVMRARGNYRLILNASLYADMALKEMDKKGVTFVCVNGIGEEQSRPSTFALKFKDGDIRDEFSAAVKVHKGKNASQD